MTPAGNNGGSTAGLARAGAMLAQFVLAAFATLYIVAFLYAAVCRIQYPFELEWLEGLLVDHVGYVLSGEPLYAAPTWLRTNSFYTPLYYYVSAAFALVLGNGFFTLRLVSTLSTFGTMAFLYLLVRHETKQKLPGLIAAGLYAATYHTVVEWFDLARIDSLFMFFYAAAIYVCRCARPGYLRALTVSLLLFCCFFAKQSGLMMALPIIAYMVIDNWRHGIAAGLLFGVAIGASTVLFDWISGGWYSFYVFKLPSEQPWLVDALFFLWTIEPTYALWVTSALAAIFLAACALRPAKSDLFYGAVAAGCLAVSWSSMVHIGGYVNNLIPWFTMCIVLATVAPARLAAKWPNLAPKTLANFRALLVAGCCLQFYWLAYDPWERLPTDAHAETGRRYIESVGALKGNVYVPCHGHLPLLAGKKTYANLNNVWELMLGNDEDLEARLLGEMEAALKRHEFDYVVIDSFRFPMLRDINDTFARWLDTYYMPAGQRFPFPPNVQYEGGNEGVVYVPRK